MTKIEQTYSLWYKIFSEEMIPLIADRRKWHFDEQDLVVNDIVYFKLKDSAMSSKWLIGKIESVSESRDGRVRVVKVSYKHDTTTGERKYQEVERPVREIVKLFNIEDTTLLEDIKKVQDAAKQTLNSSKIVTDEDLIDFGSSSRCDDNSFLSYTVRSEPSPSHLIFTTEDIGLSLNKEYNDEDTTEDGMSDLFTDSDVSDPSFSRLFFGLDHAVTDASNDAILPVSLF